MSTENPKNVGRRFLKGVLRYWPQIVKTLLCMIAMVGFSLLIPFLTKLVIDEAIPQENQNWLWLVCLGGIGAIGVYVLLSLIRDRFYIYTTRRILLDFRNRFFQHLLRLPMRSLTKRQTGELGSMVLNDVETILTSATYNVLHFFTDTLSAVAIIAIMFYLNWRLALIALVVVPLDINLDVPPGTTVALVGPSGSGKTTLTNLIPRLYEPNTGRLLLDGRDLQALELRFLRRQIGIIPQEPILFHISIKDNIRYGRSSATDAEIYAAAEAANIHEFIMSLPDQYETLVGERGFKLSGGQKQRVAIAMAILKDPKILILDEATSALDSQSESLIQEALQNVMKQRTTFVIAHRLSTIRNADQIVVMDQGRIVEVGSHSDLLAAGNLYSQLYREQFKSLLNSPDTEA